MEAAVKETARKERKFEKVVQILEENNYSRTRLIPILQHVQDEYRYLPQEVLAYIATAIKAPIAEVYGVATFYAHFTLDPKGKYVVKVCNGTACHVKGAMALVEAMQKKLMLQAGKHTTDDMEFTIETVSCVGACGLAPVVVVNDDVYGQVSPERSVEIVDIYKAKTDEV